MLEEVKKQKPGIPNGSKEHQLPRRQNSLKAELNASSDQALSKLLGLHPYFRTQILKV